MRPIRVATICMNSGNDETANVARAEALVRQAAASDARWVLLPELFPFMGDDALQFDLATGWGPRGPLVERLITLARSLGITLFAGSFAEKPAGEPVRSPETMRKVYNTMLVIGPDGGTLATYRKTHLFTLGGARGEKIIAETDGFLAGDHLVTFEHEGWRIGLCICYDLRFSGMFAKMAEAGALDVIMVPAAFTRQTGKDHWHLLLRSRAIEQQCFVVASNQTGLHGSGKESFGHALLVDPWGEIMADTGPEEGIALGVLDGERIAAVRTRLPVIAQQRRELY